MATTTRRVAARQRMMGAVGLGAEESGYDPENAGYDGAPTSPPYDPSEPSYQPPPDEPKYQPKSPEYTPSSPTQPPPPPSPPGPEPAPTFYHQVEDPTHYSTETGSHPQGGDPMDNPAGRFQDGHRQSGDLGYGPGMYGHQGGDPGYSHQGGGGGYGHQGGDPGYSHQGHFQQGGAPGYGQQNHYPRSPSYRHEPYHPPRQSRPPPQNDRRPPRGYGPNIHFFCGIPRRQWEQAGFHPPLRRGEDTRAYFRDNPM